MKAAIRAAAVVLTSAGIVLTLAGSAVAASPAPNTLGASVSRLVVTDENPHIYVENLGSLPTTFTAVAPDGWQVSPLALALDPGEQGSFTVSGRGDEGDIAVTGSPTVAVTTGNERTAIAFAHIHVEQSRPFDPSRYAVTAGLAILLLLGALLAIRRLRPWEWRITRTTSKGQGLAEYALILGLIAIVAIIALIFLGGKVSAMLSAVGTSI